MESVLSKKPDHTNNSVKRIRMHFAPLLVATVGLPARGKSILAKQLSRYLNYSGETCKVFDVSDYRRKRLKKYSSHEIFRPENIPAAQIRKQSFLEALSDCCQWLNEYNDAHHVGILDGPNVSKYQRDEITKICQQRGFNLLFIECVCENQKILEENLREILKYSSDYQGISEEVAIEDIMEKMEHYKRQYDVIGLDGEENEMRQNSFIKILDGAHSGVLSLGLRTEIEQKILGYVSLPKARDQCWYFSRHGESEFNVMGKIGGNAALSPRGQKYALALGKHFQNLNIEDLEVWTSTLQRTKETAENVYSSYKQHLHELDEIFSGECEGFTYEELLEHFPKELALRDAEKLRYRYPQGESYVDVMTRLLPVLLELETSGINILVVSHQAVLRCLLGYFLDTPLDEIPYLKVPLHTVIKLTRKGYSYNIEQTKMGIDCVDTNRPKPINCSIDRKPEDVYITIPRHFESLDGLAC